MWTGLAIVVYSLILLAFGFFIGRAERSSARISRTWEPTEHGGTPL